MNRKMKIVAAAAGLLLATGCATKKGFEVPGFAFGCPIGETKVGSMEDLVRAKTVVEGRRSTVQATEMRFDNGASFWGVQYHPEYSVAEAAAMVRRYADVLIRDGLAKDQADLDALVADLTAFHADPGDARLAWRFGVGKAITDPRIKLAEITNWLERCVLA